MSRAEVFPASNRFIIGPLADSIFFILSPLIALAIGLFIGGTDLTDHEITFFGHEETISEMFIGIVIMAHLFVAFARSHGNEKIYRLHRTRFTLIPVLLFAAMSLSTWVSASVVVIAVWWDVYHSSLQTFGIGRIYDMKRGNPPMLGRRLDVLLNHLLYAGPILGGATLMAHVGHFDEFDRVGSLFLTSIPAYAKTHSRYLTFGVLAVGLPFLVFYGGYYLSLYRRGYLVSLQKTALLMATGVTSIQAWGFNSFGEAFFIMNLFHAVQYFALVWWSEGGNLTTRLGLSGLGWGRVMAFGLFLTIAIAYGSWAEFFGGSGNLALHVTLVVSIMHFWYDGFIWSVRRKQIA